MYPPKNILAVGLALACALGLVVTIQAGSVTSGGVTLTWPEYPISGPGYTSCEPWQDPAVNTIRITGIPSGASVSVQFLWSGVFTGTPTFVTPITYTNVTSGSLTVPVAYPPTSQWPDWDGAANTKAIAMSVLVTGSTDTTTFKLPGKKWWIKCGPVPPPEKEGCTLGYWKNDAAHFDAVTWPAGYAPSDNYNTVFGVTAGFTPHTLLDALNQGGGQEDALARQGTAALLNAAAMNYVYTVGQVTAIVQGAYATGTNAAFTSAASTLAFANEGSGQGENCPLDHGNP
jgi:hypothetical protein